MPELNDTILAIRKLLDPKNVELLEKTGVFSKSEIHSRCEIFEEEYKRKVRIEAELALLMARTMIQPAAIAEYTALSNAVAGNKNLPGYKAALRSMERVGKLMDTLSEQEDELEALLNVHDVTREYVDAMNRMRLTVDSLERLVADTRWPLPKYREMLFIY